MRFAADDEQARQLLADAQSQLGELLQAQGLVAGVSVDAGGASAENAGRGGADAQPVQTRLARVSSRAAQLPADAALAQRNTVPDGRPGSICLSDREEAARPTSGFCNKPESNLGSNRVSRFYSGNASGARGE